MSETPAKYQAKERKYEQKNWLYEQYWGQMLSTREIASKVDCGKQKIRKELVNHGIPRRMPNYIKDNAHSPFRGFYNADEVTRTDERSRTKFDANFDSDESDGRKAKNPEYSYRIHS